MTKLREQLLIKEKRVSELEQVKSSLDQRAFKRANRILTLGASVMIGQFAFIMAGTYIVFSWDVMEPIAYLMSMVNFTAAFMFFWKNREEMELTSLQEILMRRHAKKLYLKYAFDEEAYDKLSSQILELRELISKTA